MSDPTAIQLSDGEKEKVITDKDAQSGLPYVVEVTGDNPVRYDHNKRRAELGVTMSAGQTHTLSGFRGSGIWVAAFDGPTELRIRPAGAAIESQPEKAVQIDGDVSIASDIDVTDRSARQIGKARIMDSSGVLVDPATGDVSAEQPRSVDTWNAGTLPVDAGTARTISAWNAGTITVDTGTVAVEQANGPVTDTTTTTGASNAAVLQLGQRSQVDVMYDLSGTATVTVEASSDGTTWRQREQISTSGEGTILINCAFEHLRAYADSNLNTIEIGAKQ